MSLAPAASTYDVVLAILLLDIHHRETTLGQQGGTSCQDFGAYHDNITYKTGDV